MYLHSMDSETRERIQEMQRWRAEHAATLKPNWGQQRSAFSLPFDQQTRGEVTAETRALVLARYDRCCGCGRAGKLTLDHVIPTTRGGDHDASNLQVLCKSCNSMKTNRTMEEWLATNPTFQSRYTPSHPSGTNPPRVCIGCGSSRRGSRADIERCSHCGAPHPLPHR